MRFSPGRTGSRIPSPAKVSSSLDATGGLSALRELGDRPAEATTLVTLGSLCWYQSRWRDAIAYYKQSLNIFREIGDTCGEGQALNGLGAVHREQRDHDEALACHERALHIFSELSDRLHQADRLRAFGHRKGKRLLRG